jgi:hypothetical protein
MATCDRDTVAAMRKCVEVLLDTSEIGVVSFTPRGLELQCCDSLNVSLSTFWFPKSIFSKYAPTTFRIKIELRGLFEFVRQYADTKIHMAPRRAHMLVTCDDSAGTHRKTVKRVTSTALHYNIPNRLMCEQTAVSVDSMATAVLSLIVGGGYTDVTVAGRAVRLQNQFDCGRVQVEFERTGPASDSFGNRFLTKFLKPVCTLGVMSNTATLSATPGGPLIVTCDFADTCTFSLSISPVR